MTDQSTEGEKPFYTKTGFLIAALFVSAVAIIGLVLALTGGSDDAPAGEAGTTPSSPAETSAGDDVTETTQPADTGATASSPPPMGEGNCPPLSGSNGEDALGSGPQVEWYPVGEVAPAFSEDNGPAVRDGVKECFAHTPAGALLAGYNFLADVRTSTHDPSEVVRARVDQGSPSYDTLLSYASEERQLSPMSVVGYRFNVTNESQAVISFVHRMPVSGEVAYLKDEVTLAWMDGDWLVTDVPDPEQIDSLPPDYVPWGPELGALE